MSNSTVFVVDDDEGSRSSMECLFGVHGINCLTFDSAEKFLEGRTEQPIGCIVTDLNMPGMSGLDLYQKTREMGWSIPTIILTAFGEV
ncbi:MAG TPA: response regulator, partial [Pirellula sp.]|nr:response regulator [Pirellula sp.]